MKLRLVWFALMTVFIVLLSACAGEVNGVREPHGAPQGTIESGRQLIAAYGCGSCHTIPGVPGADSMAGPPLMHFYQRMYIAGRLPNTPENLIAWIQHPQTIEPGTAMPNLGVSEAEAHDIAAYLFSEQVAFADLRN
jgi:cytochrome c